MSAFSTSPCPPPPPQTNTHTHFIRRYHSNKRLVHPENTILPFLFWGNWKGTPFKLGETTVKSASWSWVASSKIILVFLSFKYPGDDRVIKQFHFTAWPDHGVPSHPTPLLSLVRHTFSANRESVGPMVVHCRQVMNYLNRSTVR